MRLPTSDGSSDGGPNLTPIIDVVFLLLIFFLVATRFDQEERELDIELPEVAKAQPISMTQGLIINISKNGTYKVVRKQYTEKQLSSIIRQAKQNNPHQIALIRGDGGGALKYAVKVMSLCNKEGMKYRILAVEKS